MNVENSQNNVLSHVPYQKTQTHGIQRRNINESLPQHKKKS